jgi:hypothetical protein
MYKQEIYEAMQDFKKIWDPRGKMNPGKLIDAGPLDQNLRLGPTYDPAVLKTAFEFPEDGGSFAATANRYEKTLKGYIRCLRI